MKLLLDSVITPEVASAILSGEKPALVERLYKWMAMPIMDWYRTCLYTGVPNDDAQLLFLQVVEKYLGTSSPRVMRINLLVSGVGLSRTFSVVASPSANLPGRLFEQALATLLNHTMREVHDLVFAHRPRFTMHSVFQNIKDVGYLDNYVPLLQSPEVYAHFVDAFKQVLENSEGESTTERFYALRHIVLADFDGQNYVKRNVPNLWCSQNLLMDSRGNFSFSFSLRQLAHIDLAPEDILPYHAAVRLLNAALADPSLEEYGYTRGSHLTMVK